MDKAASIQRQRERYLSRRKEPPTIEEVMYQQWWWNFPKDQAPHVMQLDVVEGKIIDIISSFSDCESVVVFNPNDWPGEWAPCIPPE